MVDLTPLEKEILKIANRDKPDKGLVIGAVLAIREYTLEEDVQDYLDNHPNISFMVLDEFITSLCPPLEIVDDEELDEEQ